MSNQGDHLVGLRVGCKMVKFTKVSNQGDRAIKIFLLAAKRGLQFTIFNQQNYIPWFVSSSAFWHWRTNSGFFYLAFFIVSFYWWFSCYTKVYLFWRHFKIPHVYEIFIVMIHTSFRLGSRHFGWLCIQNAYSTLLSSTMSQLSCLPTHE